MLVKQGLIGSKKFVEDAARTPKHIVAMLNFDMVGKLKNNSIKVGGSRTSKESEKIIKKYAKENNLKASLSPSGIAPSGHAAPGRLSSVEQFENIVVRTGEDGSIIRLRDVARISLEAQSYNTESGINARNAAIDERLYASR